MSRHARAAVGWRETVLNGQFIRKGDTVMWFASANRDERVFETPDDFVTGRTTPIPNAAWLRE